MNPFHIRGVPAGLIALVFAVVARAMGSVTSGGAVAGIAVAFILMVSAGYLAFVPLLMLFVLTAVATRWGRRRKERLGLSERFGGRTGSQVLANLSAAAACALPVLWFPEYRELLLVAAMAALAEAAADTVSSEVGQASARSAYLIVGLRGVPVGTNGGISLLGTMSGFMAACIMAWMSGAAGLVGWFWSPIIAVIGTVGMLVDSIIGATWENSGLMGNDAVNFVSTVFAADLALVIGILMERFGR